MHKHTVVSICDKQTSQDSKRMEAVACKSTSLQASFFTHLLQQSQLLKHSSMVYTAIIKSRLASLVSNYVTYKHLVVPHSNPVLASHCFHLLLEQSQQVSVVTLQLVYKHLSVHHVNQQVCLPSRFHLPVMTITIHQTLKHCSICLYTTASKIQTSLSSTLIVSI